MKFNKWTVGLAAVGAVSLASAAKAEEHAVMTALANTTISGYVDTSAQWNIGNDTANFPPYAFGGAGKADGFNLNVVKLTLEKPMDEGEWAAGYKVDLLFGPDAVGYNASANSAGTADFGIKQAYVALRVPVLGNGVDLKIGTFDTIIGYEVFESGNNPNFTRSYGYTLEPTQHTGVLASHKFNEYISVSAGIANTHAAGINARTVNPTTGNNVQGKKAWMGAVALTAPSDWSFLSGSTLYAGVVSGFAGGRKNTDNYYIGAVIKTPVAGLTTGVALDYVNNFTAGGTLPSGESAKTLALYASYQVPDSKLSLHARAEYVDGGFFGGGYPAGIAGESVWATAVTGTVQYDLWANVISRLEFRWDHSYQDVDGFGNTTPGGQPNRSDNAYTVLANFVYKF